jgi:hypothetical protein
VRTVAVSAIAEVDAAAAQTATMTPDTGIVLASARTVSSGRRAVYS